MTALRCLVSVLLILLLLPISFGSAADGLRGGRIYESGSHGKKLLFTIHADLLAPDPETRIFVSRYVDSQGQEAMTESASFERLKLRKYTIQQNQINETYELTINGAKMHFSVTRQGRTETRDRDLPDNLVIAPSLVPYIQQHWSELQNGKKIKAQIAALDREDTYGFEFQKLREVKSGGKDAVLIQMKPTSTLVSSVVRPAYLTVSISGSQILEIRGRMLPKLKAGSRWQDFEGEAVFHY